MKSLALLAFLPIQASSQWIAGDTHIHMQQCTPPVNLSMDEIKTAMDARRLRVGAIQLWKAPWNSLPEYLSVYAPLVSGMEDVSTDASHYLQLGVEVSGFPSSKFGHVQALGVKTGQFPITASFPGPILDFYQQDSASLLGYAHVIWLNGYDPLPFYGTMNGAYMAPIDAALGKIDFIETTAVEPLPGMENATWRGLYYKLLNSGLRVSLTGGSDNSCALAQIGDAITHARVTGLVSFKTWCEAIRAGRTVVSLPDTFVNLTVSGVGVGGQLSLAAPGVIQVAATSTGPVSILRNGVEVASLPGSGTVQIPVNSSCWLSAKTFGAHTAAVYVVVADEPVILEKDAAYWIDYCDGFLANLGSVFGVPEAAPRILAAREVFSAIRARAIPWPAGVTEYGASTQAGQGPISAGVTASYEIDCLNAPPRSQGFLLLGKAPGSLSVSGIKLWIDLSSPHLFVPVSAPQSGYCKLPFQFPSGTHFFAQFVWLGAALSASDAIEVVVP